VHVLCLRDRGEPLREHRGRLTISRTPIRHASGAGTARRLASTSHSSYWPASAWERCTYAARFNLVQVNSVPDVLIFVALLALDSSPWPVA
jgi:hypothetical protein